MLELTRLLCCSRSLSLCAASVQEPPGQSQSEFHTPAAGEKSRPSPCSASLFAECGRCRHTHFPDILFCTHTLHANLRSHQPGYWFHGQESGSNETWAQELDRYVSYVSKDACASKAWQQDTQRLHGMLSLSLSLSLSLWFSPSSNAPTTRKWTSASQVGP